MGSSNFVVTIGGDPGMVPLTPAEEAERTVRLAAAAAVKVAQEQKQADAARVRSQIWATAASAEGVAVTALTAAQVKSLLVVVLDKLGGVDDNLMVRALAEWAGQ